MSAETAALLDKVTSPVAVNATGRPLAWKYLNEQEWIVDSVGRDVVEIIGYAAARKQADSKFSPGAVSFKTETVDLRSGAYSFTSVINGGKPLIVKLTLKDYIWSPDNYTALVGDELALLGLTPDTVTEATPDFLLNIANADMPALIAENERLSKALSERPLDGGLHEQAALLMVAFNRQEMCGRFCDSRPNFNRITAHLAMAKALNHNKLGMVGSIADVAIETSVCRMTVALAKIRALQKDQAQPGVATWLRALEIFATGDYRIYNAKEHSSLEERQYALFSSVYNNVDSIFPYVQEHYPSMPVEWLRIIINTTRSVEIGHTVLTAIVDEEIKSYYLDYCSYNKLQPGKDKPSADTLTEQLNFPPGRCLTMAPGNNLQVIGWNDISAFHARHILNAANCEYDFYANMYGVPEKAKASITRSRKEFGSLEQFPFVETKVKLEPPEKANYFRHAQELVVNHPERVASESWDTVYDLVKEEKTKPELVSETLWFDPVIPMGTSYLFHSRRFLPNFKADLAEMTRMKELNPYSQALLTQWVLKKYGNHATADNYLEAFDKIIAYVPNARAVAASASTNDPVKYIALLEETAKKQPYKYFDLGAFCALNNRPEQAEKFYDLAVKLSTNAVATSNQIDWLMRYKFAHGKRKEAEALAMFAGEVYSSRGLESLAHYYEMTGDIKKAEQTLLDSLERYENTSKMPLTGFYIRNADKDPRYKVEKDKTVASVFQGALKKVQLADFKAPPTQGARIFMANPTNANTPLAKGAIIVAVNGYLVKSQDQFHVARNITNADFLTAILWNGSKYVEVRRPVISGNYFGIDIETYRK